MKAKERAGLKRRVRTFGGIVHVFPNDDVRFIEREIDRAVRKARKEEWEKMLSTIESLRNQYDRVDDSAACAHAVGGIDAVLRTLKRAKKERR